MNKYFFLNAVLLVFSINIFSAESDDIEIQFNIPGEISYFDPANHILATIYLEDNEIVRRPGGLIQVKKGEIFVKKYPQRSNNGMWFRGGGEWSSNSTNPDEAAKARAIYADLKCRFDTELFNFRKES